ncbi:HlyD family efflux transporter periplasmic adaptor subunit [Candidatus Parcubacteria bacterium]|nr:HlyD family efflux transporter periplasmic adaptor subunit [Candidatus Parcubacteria bacterium]MBT7227909.1 HlyD family efflux transporter periplasmic adaptor subunit [Candidatus Parcubacteria bacterium]
MSKKLKSLSLIVVLFAMVLFTTGCGKQEEEEKPVIKKQVEVQQIARQNQVTASLLASGTVTPKQYSNIRSLVPGTVEYLSPVGSEIFVGQPLFSIRDEGIESGYFNALQNLEQTRVVTDQRVQQSQLGLNSAQARLDLAESQYNSSVAQTDQAVRVAEDSAIVAYSSAYNTLNQTLNYLTGGSIDDERYLLDKEGFYAFKDLATTNSQLKSNTMILYPNAVDNFLLLPNTVNTTNLDSALSQMQITVSATKDVVDNTAILLQGAIDGGEFTAVTIESNKLLNSNYQLQINGHVSGVITSINNITNTKISKQLSLNQAQSQLNLAKIDYDNATIGFQNAQDGATLEKNIAQTQFDSVAYSYGNLTLAAPFSGTILSHYTNMGEQVTVGQQLIEIGNLAIVEVKVDVDVDFSEAIKLGDEIMIENKYTGIVSEVEPIGDLNSGKVNVTIQSSEAKENLRAGDIAEVEIKLNYTEVDVIVVPIKSVTIEATGNYVFVIGENGKVARKNVTLDQVFGDKVSITSGLEENDQLILLNGVFVATGDEVEIITE